MTPSGGEPAEPAVAEHEGCGGVDIGPRELGAHNGGRQQPHRRGPGARVDDVLTAGGRSRRRNGARAHLEPLQNAAPVARVLDRDHPVRGVGALAVQGDVSACVDEGIVLAELGQARDEARESLLDRPPLDEAGRIEADVAATVGQPRRERAPGPLTRDLAQRRGPTDARVSVPERVPAVPDPADGAVRLPRAEQLVVGSQLIESLLDGLLDGGSQARGPRTWMLIGSPMIWATKARRGWLTAPAVGPLAACSATGALVTGTPRRWPTGVTARSRRW